MGFGEMLGVKIIKIEPKEEMTLDQLFERIKDLPFEAGTPEFVKHGLNYVIAFPPEDRENQVWIITSGKHFTVQRSVAIAGFSNMLKNMATAGILNKVTGGITGIVSNFGSPKKACMAHCEDVAAKIKEALA